MYGVIMELERRRVEYQKVVITHCRHCPAPPRQSGTSQWASLGVAPRKKVPESYQFWGRSCTHGGGAEEEIGQKGRAGRVDHVRVLQPCDIGGQGVT